MSTTTEAVPSPRRSAAFGRLACSAGVLAALVLAAGAVQAGVALVPGVATSVIVVAPPERLKDRLPEGVAILAWDGASARLTGTDRHLVASLYRAGAWLVLPARRASCLSLAGSPSAPAGGRP